MNIKDKMDEENKAIRLDKKRIERYVEKLEHYQKIVKHLKKWTKDMTETVFIKEISLKERYAIYHAYQLIIEIMADLTAMVVKDMKIKPKDDYSNLAALKAYNLFTEREILELQKANKLRNVVVHDYNTIDDKLVYKGIVEQNELFEKFYKVIKKWLEKIS